MAKKTEGGYCCIKQFMRDWDGCRVELNNPAGLNVSGAITLEAWVQPAASQPQFDANIIAHGVNDCGSAEVALRIENGNYEIVTFDGSNHKASFPVPNDDLGSGNWAHIVGTYDGTTYRLYRNGVEVANSPDATGAVPVNATRIWRHIF